MTIRNCQFFGGITLHGNTVLNVYITHSRMETMAAKTQSILILIKTTGVMQDMETGFFFFFLTIIRLKLSHQQCIISLSINIQTRVNQSKQNITKIQ